MEARRCSICDTTKPAVAFTMRRTHRPGKLVSECTPCKVERNRRYRIENRERFLEIERRSKLKVAYGLSIEAYSEMLAAQGGGCAICGANEPSGRTKHFAIDHCHTTGVIRGLLCTKCNRGLGLFNDNTDRMERAVKYLKGDLSWL